MRWRSKADKACSGSRQPKEENMEPNKPKVENLG